MMVKNTNIAEHQERVRMGEMAHSFLGSENWTILVKPILDSFVKGLIDARDIDVSSDKKAAIEVKSRVLAAKYIESIEAFLEQYVIDGKVSQELLTPKEDKAPLYRTRRTFDSSAETQKE